MTTPRKDFLQQTLDGELWVEIEDGKIITHPLRTVAFVEPLPFNLTISHVQYMKDLYEAIEDVRLVQPMRIMPITADEAPDFFNLTEVVENLIDAGLIRICAANFNDSEHQVIYFTPQGRAFIRKYIDHSYAVTTET